jgi:hypothetical protein
MLVPLAFRHVNSEHHNERDLHDLRKVLWREIDHNTGVACELMAIDAFSSHRSDRIYPEGLRFRYTLGVERQFGCCTAGLNTTVESVELGSDKIIYFERRIRRDENRIILAVSVTCPHPRCHFSGMGGLLFLSKSEAFRMRLCDASLDTDSRRKVTTTPAFEYFSDWVLSVSLCFRPHGCISRRGRGSD